MVVDVHNLIEGRVRWCSGCRAAHGGWHAECPRCGRQLSDLPKLKSSHETLPEKNTVLSTTTSNQLTSRRGPKPRLYTLAEKSMTLNAWAAEAGLRCDTLRCRLRRGWSLDAALSKSNQVKKDPATSLMDKIKMIVVEIADLEISEGVLRARRESLEKILSELRSLCCPRQTRQDTREISA